MTGALALFVPLTADPDKPPNWCFQPNAAGQLPICSFSNGHWSRIFSDGGPGDPSGGSGFGAIFGVFAVVAVLAIVGGFAYRISAARRMARNAGIDEGDAVAMTLTSRDGLAATYLAANLRQPTAPASPPVAPGAPAPAPSGTAARRLAELKGLLDQGLIDQDEYAARRRVVIDSV